MADTMSDSSTAGPHPPGRRGRRLMAAALVASLLAVGAIVLATGGEADRPERRAAASAGPVIPAFSIETLSGETFSFPTGRPTAIYFTGSTCSSCLPKAMTLDRIEREANGGLAVLGVDIDGFDTEEMFRDWIAHAGSPRHSFAMDLDFRLSDLFEVAALSTVVVTDDAGRMVWRSADQVSDTELRRVLARAGLR